MRNRLKQMSAEQVETALLGILDFLFLTYDRKDNDYYDKDKEFDHDGLSITIDYLDGFGLVPRHTAHQMKEPYVCTNPDCCTLLEKSELVTMTYEHKDVCRECGHDVVKLQLHDDGTIG